MGFVDGVEVLDQSAGQLVPEARDLVNGRILLRIYSEHITVEQVRNALTPYPNANVCDVVRITDDWKEQWKSFFHRTVIGQRIVVRPPWEEASTDANHINVVIEPGMAFGTGLHETTQLCAQVLEQTLIEDTQILDVGCGSGILSIIAAKLGAEHIQAIDIDPDSIAATRENSERNGVASLITSSTNSLATIEQTFDLVVANILSHILVELAADLCRCVRHGGKLLLSGILLEKADGISTCFRKHGMQLETQKQDGQWVAQVWRRLR